MDSSPLVLGVGVLVVAPSTPVPIISCPLGSSAAWDSDTGALGLGVGMGIASGVRDPML